MNDIEETQGVLLQMIEDKDPWQGNFFFKNPWFVHRTYTRG